MIPSATAVPEREKFGAGLLKLRKADTAVREIRETPTFVYRDLCDGFPVVARQDHILAEYAQLVAANDAFAALIDLASHRFHLRFQRRAFLPHESIKIAWLNARKAFSD
jgi:hypothetical protein